MTIAMLVYSHYSRDARVRRYAESLARKGHNIDIICLKESYQPKEKNIRLIMYPLPRRCLGKFWYLIEYLLFFIFSFMILNSYFLIRHYRLIHVHNMPDFLVFATVFQKLFGAKIILDLHDPMPELYMSKYHDNKDSSMVKLLRWLERLSIKYSNYTITANPAFKEIFLIRNSDFGKKIRVILNCPDPRIFKNSKFEIRNSKFILMYMGTIDERFNLEMVIDALKILLDKNPSLKFRVIIISKINNEGKYFYSLKNKVLRCHLDKHVVFLNPMPLENITKQLKKVDVGLVLAKNGVFTESIFPVKLLEFIQMGVPVIATKTKILSQYFDDNSILFLSKNTPTEFAEVLMKLEKDRNFGKRLAKNAKKYLTKYNWKKEEAKYLRLVNSLIAI